MANSAMDTNQPIFKVIKTTDQHTIPMAPGTEDNNMEDHQTPAPPAATAEPVQVQADNLAKLPISTDYEIQETQEAPA